MGETHQLFGKFRKQQPSRRIVGAIRGRKGMNRVIFNKVIVAIKA